MHDTGGRHRRSDPYYGRHRFDEVRVAARGVTTLVLVSIGIGSLGVAGGSEPQAPPPTAIRTASAAEIEARQRTEASRSLPRATPSAVPTPSAVATKAPVPATPSTKATPKVTKTTAKPKVTATQPEPVGDLNQRQMNHAAVIVRVGKQLGLPQRAYVIAIATALQESYLRNLANEYYPESLDLANDGVAADHDSVGLFQQRPSSGWGTVEECMDPAYAARAFYEGLMEVVGWEDLSLTEAAQAVQVSAYPDAYAKHEDLATEIIEALT